MVQLQSFPAWRKVEANDRWQKLPSKIREIKEVYRLRAVEWVNRFLCDQEIGPSSLDRTWFGKSFVRLLQVPVTILFSSYFFSISLAKLEASTTNRTWDGDPGCGQYEE